MEITELTINPMLKDSFSVERLVPQHFPPGQACRADHHQVLFLVDGRGEVLVDGEPAALSDNSLLLLSKGQVYMFNPGQKTPSEQQALSQQQEPPEQQALSEAQVSSGYLLQFGDCFWQRTPASASNCKAVLFDHPGVSRHLQPSPADLAPIHALFRATLQEFEAVDYSNKADVLAAYLKILIIKIANLHSLLQKELATFDGKLYQDFLALVRKEYYAAHDVSFFANRLGVSSRKLADTCKQHGAGAKESINEQLIAEAKRLLQFSSRSIKEAAGELGFATPYQFSNFFKRYTSLSPMEYKQQFVNIGI